MSAAAGEGRVRADGHWAETLEMRLASRLGLRPVPLGALVAGSLLALYAGVESLFGSLLERPLTPEVFGFSVAAVLAGYAMAAGHAIGAAQAGIAAELEGVMQVPRPDSRLLRAGRAFGVAALLLAAAFMLVVDTAVRLLVTRGEVTSDAVLSMLCVPLAFLLIMRATFFTMAFLLALSRQAAASLEVDLLETGRLAPLGRAGLQGALLFVGAAVLASLSVAITGGSAIEFALVGALLLAATAAFLYPVRGSAARIRAAKQRELSGLRREIRRDRARLADDDPAAAARLPALLAYEARVERSPEWPFDSPTLLRFALLLLLPLLSWLGGALAERALDAVW